MHNGFTLIELVMTLIVIAILAGVVGPKMLNSNGYAERMYFDQVVSLLELSERYAIATGCDVQIATSISGNATLFTATTRLNCYGGLYSANTGAFANNLVLQQTSASPFQSDGTVTVPSSVTVNPTSFPFYFTPEGKVKGSASGLITNPQLSIGSHTLNIVGQSGYVND